jgi:hypothetical protein
MGSQDFSHRSGPFRDRAKTTPRVALGTLPRMKLNPLPIHPVSGGYVLRLHRDARPAEGQFRGRVQHVASGEWADFASGAELLAWLVGHAERAAVASREQP